MPSTASRRPVAAAGAAAAAASSSSGGAAAAAAAAARRRSEIFVDIIERVSAVLAANGNLLHAWFGGGLVASEGCNFHECVDLSLFESERLLSFKPPSGEFILMNYRIPSLSNVPFRVLPTLEDLGRGRAEVTLRVRNDIPNTSCAANIVVSLTVPKSTAAASLEAIPSVAAQARSAEFIASEHRVQWVLKKFQGGSELAFVARLTFHPWASPPLKTEFGPCSLDFEIPMYSISSLQVSSSSSSRCRGRPFAAAAAVVVEQQQQQQQQHERQ
ncbi:hypothetical protein, conserved [Eimeria necatrix]|uniref:MHD domain-containing protein n=1 Tax=Eimeria necatrix TaxID=51315 RepID=U6MN38_9EIME|nr:hypothetical protein, conserved [Eimeria necatrix]CDJ65451.1 hypothetical protein, conserved [Eimeria necatrix]